MSITLLNLSKLIAKEFGYLSGTCSAAGTSTTIVDTSGDSPFDTGEDSSLLDSAWAKIESDSAGTPLNVGEVRRLKTTGGYTPSSQTVTTASAFSNATTTTQSYGVYLKVPPTRVGLRKGLDEYINEVLRTRRYRHWQLLSLVTDGDMESAVTTSWTGANSTLAKVTTAASVGKGKRALSVTTTDVNGYAESVAIPVTGNQTLVVVADLAANTGTAKLQLWDATNGAEITSVNTTEQAPCTLSLTNATTPSTCMSVKVRLIGEGSGDVAVWDNVSVRPIREMAVTLPSWVTRRGQIEGVHYSIDEGYSVENGVLVRDSRKFASVFDSDLLEDYGAANQFRLVVPTAGMDAHIFAVGHRYYDELSADTDTTDADQDWIKAAVLASIYREQEESAKTKYWSIIEQGLDRQPRWLGRVFKPVHV